MYCIVLYSYCIPQNYAITGQLYCFIFLLYLSELYNYRPITSILCKIMKQFIRDYIIRHFLHIDFFSKNQFGFLKGRSTVLQLLHIMQEWTAALENGRQINTIYADFEKAFDKAPHHLLLKKIAEL